MQQLLCIAIQSEPVQLVGSLRLAVVSKMARPEAVTSAILTCGRVAVTFVALRNVQGGALALVLRLAGAWRVSRVVTARTPFAAVVVVPVFRHARGASGESVTISSLHLNDGTLLTDSEVSVTRTPHWLVGWVTDSAGVVIAWLTPLASLVAETGPRCCVDGT